MSKSEKHKFALKVIIHTDGACYPNPDGPGGWAAIVEAEGHKAEMYGFEPSTTNNRMELTAALRALTALWAPAEVVIATDSRYLVDGATDWIKSWRKKDFVRRAKFGGLEEVPNADLWRQIDSLQQQHHVLWRWVKGHSGNPDNERCDYLANRARLEKRFSPPSH